jgi:DNA invertase Pin-like site-specific DNA recombinase
MNPKLTSERLTRRAVVYVRQSSPGQVLHHLESQRRQYELADRARELGFKNVVVIDEDLGRSGSGLVERPGFQRLVGAVCSGEVGAIFCIEASRLARNGRDWHHLIELCGMTGAVVIDPDGVYDPAIVNDRLLLGLKGTMSEFELNLLRQRSFEAIRQKAGRGELRFCLPVGYLWTAHGKVEMDPDQRTQQALRLVFSKMTELGSMRQVLLWFRRERVPLPMRSIDPSGEQTVWNLPVYNSVLKLLTNPMYAGAYAFGKTQARTTVIEGRARKTFGHKKPQADWTVLLRDHHPGYISWEQYESNQAMIAANAHMKSRMQPKAGRGGRALLSGLLRCRRCGRMLGSPTVAPNEPSLAITARELTSIMARIGVSRSVACEAIKPSRTNCCARSAATRSRRRWRRPRSCASRAKNSGTRGSWNWSRPAMKRSFLRGATTRSIPTTG